MRMKKTKCKKNKSKKKKKKKKHSDCKFINRINPDAEGFDIFVEICKIQNYITQSNEEEIKELENKMEEQKNKFAKELLSYVSSISMSSKHIKYFVKKSTYF